MGSANISERRAPLGAWYVIVPFVTLLFLSFGAVGLLYGGLSHGFDRVVLLLLTPAGMALLAGPGYVYAWASYPRWPALGPTTRLWILVSLLLALLACGAATIASLPTGLGPALCIWAFVLSARLLLRWRREAR